VQQIFHRSGSESELLSLVYVLQEVDRSKRGFELNPVFAVSLLFCPQLEKPIACLLQKYVVVSFVSAVCVIVVSQLTKTGS